MTTVCLFYTVWALNLVSYIKGRMQPEVVHEQGAGVDSLAKVGGSNRKWGHLV